MDITKILADLRAERSRIDQAISAMEALAKKTGAQVSTKRVLSAEGRRRISEAARKRWAAARKTAAKKNS